MHGPVHRSEKPTDDGGSHLPGDAPGRPSLTHRLWTLPGPVRLTVLVGALLAAFAGAAAVLPPDGATRATASDIVTRASTPGTATPEQPAAGRSATPGGTGTPTPQPQVSPDGVAVLRSRPSPAKSTPATRPSKRPASPPARRAPGGDSGGAAAAPDRITALENEVTALVNQERGRAGCGRVGTDERLRKAARAHSLDMARNDYFSHDGRNGSTPWDRAERAGYPNPIGENIAKGQRTAASVMDGWMNSDGHRRNILNCRAREIGVGLAYDGSAPVWTQLFGAG